MVVKNCPKTHRIPPPHIIFNKIYIGDNKDNAPSLVLTEQTRSIYLSINLSIFHFRTKSTHGYHRFVCFHEASSLLPFPSPPFILTSNNGSPCQTTVTEGASSSYVLTTLNIFFPTCLMWIGETMSLSTWVWLSYY